MINSIKKNRYGIILMCLSSICVCIGQLFWKLSTDGKVLFMLVGFFFYGIGAIIMLVAYKHGSLSVLQPMLSLNYVFGLILAHWVLNETMSISKFFGVLTIIIGMLLIAGGDD